VSIDNILAHNPKLDQYVEPEMISSDATDEINAEIVKHLFSTGKTRKTYHGTDAKKLSDEIFQYLQERITAELQEYDESLLIKAYKERELIEARRIKKWIELEKSGNQVAAQELIDRDFTESSENSRTGEALQQIIAMILKEGIRGKRVPELKLWRALKALAAILLEVSIISDYLHDDLSQVSLTVTNKNIRLNDPTHGFNYKQHLRKTSEERVKALTSVDDKGGAEEPPDDSPELFEIPPFPEILKPVEESFIRQLGFSMEDFIFMLYVLGQVPDSSEPEFPLIIVTEGNLLRFVKEHIFPDKQETTIRAMLNFVSLDFDTYDDVSDIIPSRLLRIRGRLTLSPIVRIGSGRLMFGNQMCLAACHLWLSYMSHAEMPFFDCEDSKIRTALNQYHDILDQAFEDKVIAVTAGALGEHSVTGKLLNFKRLSPLLPSRPDCGEIDVLATNKQNRTVFVLEAKNRSQKFRPADMARNLRDFFHGPKSYLAHLTRKWEFIKDNLALVLSYFQINDVDGWKVKKAFVIPRNYAILHDTRHDVDIVIVDELEDYLLNCR
jgi:hypothetical protein